MLDGSLNVSGARPVTSMSCLPAREGGRRAPARPTVTKDEDFAIWRIASSAKAPPVVWLRMGNTRRSELLERMEFLLPQVLAGLESGEALIEIR
jgi:predicted nuclease of predicted toxin-antitoxin system